jgi:hypothetical protein
MLHRWSICNALTGFNLATVVPELDKGFTLFLSLPHKIESARHCFVIQH